MASHKKDVQLLADLEGFIRNIITDLNIEPTKTRGQPRILPALALWSGMLVAVIRGFNAQLDIWRLLTQQGLWDFPRFTIGDDAVYKRLKHASTNTLRIVFEQVTLLLNLNFKAPMQTLASFAGGVFALDEMTLDQVKKRLPSLRGSQTAVLPGTISALFDVRRQLWYKIEFHENTLQNEKIAARSMLEHIPVGSLILADLGYFAFAWFDQLTTQGLYWISRLRAKTSYQVIHTLFERDGMLDAIVWLGAYRADQAGQAVRLVKFTRQGQTWQYITNVLDPNVLSIREISLVYARRWDIEMMFNLIKTHLKLHWLWSSHLSVVLHQVFAVFTVSQVILATRAELASRANADVFDVSLDLMIRWLPRFAADGVDPVKVLVERGRAAKIIRGSTRMKWVVEDVGLQGYSFLPSGTVLVRAARYAGKT